MKKRISIFFIYIFVIIMSFTNFSFGENYVYQQSKDEKLNTKYKRWLDLTHYIITPEEKNVFESLSTDRERDAFIKAFWKQRDPTEGTPRNEYQEEHIKRFAYANEYFGRGTSRPGWMTDRGKYYIILGPPSSIDRFQNTKGIFPTLVWYYYGDEELGLPTYFGLVFYQRHGAGEYKLYNPTSDGPTSLMRDPLGVDVTDYQKQYEKIAELAPSLARIALTNIPGEVTYNYNPSLRSNILLSTIDEVPKKEVKTTYATHFLDYKGYVSTEYLSNYVECDAELNIIKDPILDVNFVHFSVAPQKVSIDYYEPNDQYYCNYSLNVSMRKGEKVIYQYSKDFPFYFKQDDTPRIRASGISIKDSFPTVEGQYNLTILIQNSVAKEFSIYEEDISIPEGEIVQILDPFLSYRVEQNNSNYYSAYKIHDKEIQIDPKSTFSIEDEITLFFNIINTSQEIWEKGKVEIKVEGTESQNPVVKSIAFDLDRYRFNETLDIFVPLPSNELKPDYYDLNILLKDGDSNTIDSEKLGFVISSHSQISHPISLYKTFPKENTFLYFYNVANSYSRINAYQKAESNFKKAYELKPDYHRGVIVYARFLLGSGKLEQALKLIEDVKGDEELKFDYYFIKGSALMNMEEYKEAIDNLLEGNKIYNSDIGLLNSLGYCYYKTNQNKKALDALKASIKLNPEQEEIKNLIDKIEKKTK